MNNPNISNQDLIITSILIFLFSFFIIILITAPGLQVNDEWITVNQLHQLSQGHQVLTNEGKYGTVLGEMIAYFSYRHNVLGYSLFLPITGLIPLLFIQLFGDSFRLAILIIWVTIPVIISLLINTYYPDKYRWKGIPLLMPGIIISGLLLYANLFWYYPFSSAFDTAPIESAAIVLSNHIFFSITCVIIFLIGNTIEKNKKTALLFIIAIISCSSYIFWGTNAKDHMITTMLLAIILLCFIKYSTEVSKKWAYYGFFCSGILMWARAEIGFTLFLFLVIFYLIQELRVNGFEMGRLRNIFLVLLIPCIFFGGLYPILCK